LGGSILGGSGQSGAITLKMNALSVSSTNAITTTGMVTLQPYTSGATIGVGSGSGTLSLPASLFSGASRLVTDGASSIVLGSSTAGDITVGGANSFTDNVSMVTGGT
jgi:hypothetical protein